MTEGPVARPVIHAAHSGDRAYLARSLETGEEAIIVTRLAVNLPSIEWAHGRADPKQAGAKSRPGSFEEWKSKQPKEKR